MIVKMYPWPHTTVFFVLYKYILKKFNFFILNYFFIYFRKYVLILKNIKNLF